VSAWQVTFFTLMRDILFWKDFQLCCVEEGDISRGKGKQEEEIEKEQRCVTSLFWAGAQSSKFPYTVK
jgi:hypothetical protein